MIRMAWITSGYIPSPGRMAVIAGTTFTQLVRMKVFLFLGLFAVALLALSSFRLSAVLGPETGGINELVLLKNSAYGAMRVFGLFFCVAATALIIPRDAEDRILYTILCKPVPRIDYLMGKVLGVLALTLVAVLLMDAVMTLVLWMRTDTVVAEQIASLKGRYTLEEMQPYLDRIRLQGATWNVQTGLGVMMCEFVVLSSLTLLMSCVTNGTIISALLTFMIYLAGLFQTQALSLWVGSGTDGLSWWEVAGSRLFSLVFPNFQIYSVTDSALNGRLIPLSLFGTLALITLGYFVFHMTLAVQEKGILRRNRMKDIINARCSWAGTDELYIKYHDEEWGRPVSDDKTLFEFLVLESAQAGLSWLTILRKREGYRRAFHGFDVEKVARMTAKDVERLMRFDGIVKNRLKINSAINNAKLFMAVQEEFGSFYRYVLSFFPNHQPIVNHFRALAQIPAVSPESEAMSRDMKRRGFRFFGPTICYAFFQATGFVNDHIEGCFCKAAQYAKSQPHVQPETLITGPEGTNAEIRHSRP